MTAPRYLMLKVLALAAALMITGSVDAQVPCPPCAESMCLNHPDLERVREEKRARMRALGYPERLIALLDRESPCPRCIHMAPDGFTIVMEYPPNSPEAATGASSHAQPWSRDLERWARRAMRRGQLRGFHIVLGAMPCNCCGTETVAEERDDWDERVSINTDRALNYTDPTTLGPDPDDLREPTPPELPPVPPPSDVLDERIAQAVCPSCVPAADARNEAARRVNELRRLLRRRIWEVEITEQAYARTMAHGIQRSRGGNIDQFPREVRAELDARAEERERSHARRREAWQQLRAADAEFRARVAALAACEARPCVRTVPVADAVATAPRAVVAATVPRPLSLALMLGAGLGLVRTDHQLVLGLFGSYAVTRNRLGYIMFAPAIGMLGGSLTMYLPVGFGYLFPTPLARLFVSARLGAGYVAQIFSAGPATLAQHGFLLLPEIGVRYALPWLAQALWLGADLVSVPMFFYANGPIAVTYRMQAFFGISF